MSQTTANNTSMADRGREGTGKGVRAMVMGLAFFAAGITVSALWTARAPGRGASGAESGGTAPLSAATQAVLQRLGSPVEIRFYSLLDPGSVGEDRRELAGRVDQMLARYEQAAGGKIKVARVNTISAAAANAAEADGIKAFNRDKGEVCYFGIAVVRGGHKESVASLAPEWEPALEWDLSRAIAGVETGDPPAALAARKASGATLEAVRRAIPNLAAVSVEEGSRQLRAAAVTQFKKTGQEMEAKVKQAEERYLQAESSQSQTELEAAGKELEQAKKEQAAKLKEIVMESKAQIEALQQIKAAQ
ncbi:MAG: Gldg family protein [Verrucomicrobiota bacterium]|jgi:hypothetical protein